MNFPFDRKIKFLPDIIFKPVNFICQEINTLLIILNYGHDIGLGAGVDFSERTDLAEGVRHARHKKQHCNKKTKSGNGVG